MSNREILIATLVLMLALMVVLLKIINWLITPRYIKSKSFLKMDDNEKCIENTGAFEVSHIYIGSVESMFVEEVC